MNETLRNLIAIVVLIAISFSAGYLVNDRRRSAEIGAVRTEFERELAAARERNKELERILNENGSIIADLRTENILLRRELDNAKGFVGSLSGILEQDRNTIDGIIQLIRELRSEIKAYKEGSSSIDRGSSN